MVCKKKLPYEIIHCPLFLHMKHSHACVSLRARKVCRMSCKNFFEWAKENEETVKEVIKGHEGAIRSHLKSYGLEHKVDLLPSVMPKGGSICGYCGKDFKTEGGLERHQKKKHKREVQVVQSADS